MESLKKPEIWAFLAALFVVFGLFVSSFEQFPPIENTFEILLVTLIGISAYLFGVKFDKRLKYLGFIPIPVSFVLSALFLRNILGLNILFSAFLGIIPLIAYGLVRKAEKGNSERLYLILFCIGFLIFLVNIVLNGIPLLNSNLHFEKFEIIFPLLIPSFYLMIYPSVRTEKRRNLFFLILSISLFVSTLRFYIFIALFAWALLSVNTKKKKKVYVILITVLLSMFFLQGYLYDADFGAGYVKSTVRRPAFTLSVLDKIVENSFPWGSSPSCLVNDCGSQVCQKLFSYKGRLSSSAFGYIFYSFGIPGLIIALGFLGAVLSNLKSQDFPIYCILLPYLITTIERGFAAGELVIFTYLGYSVIWWRSRYGWKRLRKAV